MSQDLHKSRNLPELTFRQVLSSREHLRVGAVVPQCLDVHYLTDEIYALMMKGRKQKDYYDDSIRELRRVGAHAEYRRALIYAPQVVVNRAFLFSQIVYADFMEREDNEANRNSFKKLIEDRAIVPFLINRRLEDDAVTLDYSDEGAKAVVSLNRLLPEMGFVRLADEDELNKQRVSALGRSFRHFCLTLSDLANDAEALLALTGEVFQREISHEELAGFRQSLVAIADYGRSRGDFKREDLYDDLLVCRGTKHHQGLFRSPRDNPFVMAQKKVIDLKYNANLPELLNRFTLTPLRLPTHAALDPWQDVVAARNNDPDRDLWLESLRRAAVAVHSDAQKTFVLPPLTALTISDVCAIRALPEWHAFVTAQEDMLKDPLGALDRLEHFGRALENFQAAFAAWHYSEYGFKRRLEKYSSRVSLAISVAGVTFTALAGRGFTEVIAAGKLADFVPRSVKGWVARLVVEAVDQFGRVDRRMSYSFDINKNWTVLTRSDLEDLFSGYFVDRTTDANSGAA